MLTLNQTVEILKNFSLKHKVLKGSFYFGDLAEHDTSEQIVYPHLQAVLQSSDITDDVVNRRFTIVVSDLVNKDESNETHALSDCELICFDLLNYLEQVETDGTMGMQSIKNASLTDFTERFDDEVSGWFFDITISSHIAGYSCDLPINAGSILDANYIYIGNDMASDFIVEIKDQYGNVLQTFNTSGQYTVEVLTLIRDTITANTSTIIDPIV